MWHTIDIPIRLVNEEMVTGKEPFVHRYTSISVPTQEYEGYHFLFPSQLISQENDRITLSIPQDFRFFFIKRNKVQGKRYKRFKMYPHDFLKLYEPYQMELIEEDKRKQNATYQIKGILALAKYPYYLGRFKQGSETSLGLIIDKWFYPRKYENGLNESNERKQVSAKNFHIIYTFGEISVAQYNKAYGTINTLANLLLSLDNTKKSYFDYQDITFPVINACSEVKKNILKKIQEEVSNDDNEISEPKKKGESK